MKPIPAIVERSEMHDETQCAHALLALRAAETQELKAEGKLTKAREESARCRLELGRALMRARTRWPARGPRAKGWGLFLQGLAIDDRNARNWMALAGYVDEFSESNGDDSETPTQREVNAARRQDEPEAPVTEWHREAPVEPDAELDRNTWCTPKWIADALGVVDLDPCSNARSHIQARATFDLDRGDDGLKLARDISPFFRVFINPPYERGAVLRWVNAYRHTRFVFLLRLDPSTEWFDELYAATALILIPKGDRIEFEPPPDVTASKNPFPHGLFFARAEDATPALLDRCYRWRVEN